MEIVLHIHFLPIQVLWYRVLSNWPHLQICKWTALQSTLFWPLYQQIHRRAGWNLESTNTDEGPIERDWHASRIVCLTLVDKPRLCRRRGTTQPQLTAVSGVGHVLQWKRRWRNRKGRGWDEEGKMRRRRCGEVRCAGVAMSNNIAEKAVNGGAFKQHWRKRER